jgi:alkylation response protein AidB-like acyl-CoA dehydrogenase
VASDRIGDGDPTWLDELTAFLADNWNPDLTVGEWWERLGRNGWAAPTLPADCYGRGLSRPDAMVVQRTIRNYGALGAPDDMGIWLASPTIATHGTREQIDRYIPDAVTGRKWWCQLFSEPGAGSDLAGLTTKAVRDGDHWIITGQKVWTSGGDMADMGMLLARTDPTAPKHQGISWFAFDMHQAGVEVRPLKEMTGSAYFCEVFITEAIVEDAARIGDLHNGWAVANTTLFYERSSPSGAGDGTKARAGSVAGDLSRRAGDFVTGAQSSRPKTKQMASTPATMYIDLAREAGRAEEANIRQRIAHDHILNEVARLNGERGKALRAAGRELRGLANLSKLLAADILRHERDLGMDLLGPRGMLHAYTPDQRDRLDRTVGGGVASTITRQALSAQALPIYGGTDQIQRNIIGERVLGLPKEPDDLSRKPFNELPRNG